MTPEPIKEITAKLHDPIIVYSSATDVSGSTLVALWDLQSKNQTSGIPEQLCAVIRFDAATMIGTVNLITSTYDKSDEKHRN